MTRTNQVRSGRSTQFPPVPVPDREVVIPEVKIAPGEPFLNVDGALPTDQGVFICEMALEDGGVVKMVFPRERAEGARAVVRAALAGLLD